MSTEKTKFTATLVTPADKARIVELRKLTGLSEKEVLTLVIDEALEHQHKVLAKAKVIVEEQNVAKAARKLEAAEATKAKIKEVRAAAKAAKLADKAVQTETVQ